MNFDDRLKKLKNELDEAKLNRARAQAKLEELEKNQNSINEEIRALGIEPDDLESSVKNLKDDIETLLAKAEADMNNVESAS